MKKQLKSFGYAFEGIFCAIKSEAHLRFHLVAAFYVFLFAFLGEFTPTQWAVLAVTCALVIFAELVNTAAEEICDLYSTHQNPKIKRIKDICAGAVLVLAAAACVVAVCLFLCTGKLLVATEKLTAAPLWFIPLGVSCVGAVLFVLCLGKGEKKNK